MSWLLRLYPRSYRTAHGEVIRATLLDAADAHGGRHSARDLAGVAVHALRVRLRLTPDALPGRIATAAAPLAAGSCFALSTTAFAFGEWAPWVPHPWRNPAGPGPFQTLGAFVYLMWIIAVVLAAVTARRWIVTAGAALAGALALATPTLATVTGLERPPMVVLLTVAAFGALVTAAPRDPTLPAGEFGWAAAGAGAVLTLALTGCMWRAVVAPDDWMGPPSFFHGDLHAMPLVLLAVGLFALAAALVLHPNDLRWTVAVVLVGLTWLPLSYQAINGQFPREQWLTIARAGLIIAATATVAASVGYRLALQQHRPRTNPAETPDCHDR